MGRMAMAVMMMMIDKRARPRDVFIALASAPSRDTNFLGNLPKGISTRPTALAAEGRPVKNASARARRRPACSFGANQELRPAVAWSLAAAKLAPGGRTKLDSRCDAATLDEGRQAAALAPIGKTIGRIRHANEPFVSL